MIGTNIQERRKNCHQLVHKLRILMYLIDTWVYTVTCSMVMKLALWARHVVLHMAGINVLRSQACYYCFSLKKLLYLCVSKVGTCFCCCCMLTGSVKL